MIMQKISLFLTFILLSSLTSFGQANVNCAGMAPMCAGGVTFPAQTSGAAPAGNNYSCLGSQPNPTWFYAQVGTSGTINLTLSSNNDIDFIMYGPFANQGAAAAGCGNLGNGGTGGSVIDCSYSASATEYPDITNAIAGQVYIILVTNYSGASQQITLNQTGGSGTLDCGILTCSVTAINATIGACNPYTNAYSVTGTITASYPPATGSLIVENCDGIQQVINAPFPAGNIPFNLSGITSGGGPCFIHAYFTDTVCELSVNYNPPPVCNYCSITGVTATNISHDCQGLWTTALKVYFINPPSTGNLVAVDCNGDTTVLASAPFASPLTDSIHTIQGQVAAGNCSVHVFFTAQPSCTFTKNTAVPATPLIKIDSVSTTDVSCNSSNDGSAVVHATTVDSYSINMGASTQPSNTFSNLIAGNYTVIAYNTTGCTDTSNFVINQPAPLKVVAISPDSAICNGATITLTATGGGGNGVYKYTWLNNGSLIDTTQTVSVTPKTTDQYYVVIVSEPCGSPVAMDTVHVWFTPDISPLLMPDTTIGCAPTLIHFANLTPLPNTDHVTYSFGDGYQAVVHSTDSVTHEYDDAGIFDVRMTITTVENCVYDSLYSKYIHIYDYPVADFNYSPTNVPMFDPTVTLTDASSYSAVSWYWNIPEGNPNSSTETEFKVEYPEGVVADYKVTLYVKNEIGCIDSITKIIPVVSDVIVYAPNTFTPDGDGFNQTWRVFTQGLDPYSFDLLIFDRWGEIMWESHDYNASWDGTYGGKVVPDGTYIWIIHSKSEISDQKFDYKGHVTILR